MMTIHRMWGILLFFILVLGGIYGGIFTPAQAGAVGAFRALVRDSSKRQITWQNFVASLSNTGRLTGMIFILIIGAMVFNYFLAVTEIPFVLAEFIGGFPIPPVLVMSAILVMYIVLGFIMDIMSVMVLTVPIVYPILIVIGIDPVWFGVLVVSTIMMGAITPRVGMVVYAVGGLVKDTSLFTIFRGVWAIPLCHVACLGHPDNFPPNLTLVTRYDETGMRFRSATKRQRWIYG